jgi:hypothetical protein
MSGELYFKSEKRDNTNEKVNISYVLNKLLAFYRTLRFITVSTRVLS